MRNSFLNHTLDLFEGTDNLDSQNTNDGLGVKMKTFLVTIEEPPRGGVQSRNLALFVHFHALTHTFFSFLQKHTNFWLFPFSLHHTHFFPFHAITQWRIANKGHFTPSRTAKRPFTHRVTVSSIGEINFTNWRSTQKQDALSEVCFYFSRTDELYLLQNIKADERNLLFLPDMSRSKTPSLPVLCFLSKQSDGGTKRFLGITVATRESNTRFNRTRDWEG